MDETLVKVKQGILRGRVKENIEGGKYIVFQGIPYAEPPVGELRFKDPRSALPWIGIRNALEKGKKAAQIDGKTGDICGEDDCLYLNVATNALSGKKPVMVWIHGGAFAYSSGDLDYFGPDYLLKHDVVFVTFNYRVGMIGFLNLELEVCPGNQGLKDQICVLSWIRENIEAFGGDKENVTIFGGSSGSAAVHFLCTTSTAKGLFHKAICQSGVINNPSNFQTSNKNFGFEIAAALGKKNSDPKEVLNFLRSMPTHKILRTQLKLMKNNHKALFVDGPFLPSLDTSISNPLFPKPLTELVKSGINVPLIIGYNSFECMLSGFDSSDETLERLNNNFEEILGLQINENGVVDVSEFTKQVRHFYFEKNSITVKERENLMQFRGDIIFVNGIQYVVEKQMHRRTPTFFYRFSYKANNSLLCRSPINENIQGAHHAEDNFFLFYRPLLGRERQLKKGTKDYLMMKRMTKMWTNFAKYGDPTPEIDDIISSKWTPLSSNRKCYLEIGDSIFLGEDPDKESWNLWKPILEFENGCCNLGM